MGDVLPSEGRRRLLQTLGGGAGALAVGSMAGARAESPKEVLDVAILGGGLAGLTAARDLARAGCDSFVVLEARNRVGGRTFNHDLGHGVVSEAGGQWAGPGQTAVLDLARELGVDTFDSYYAGRTIFLAGDARVAQDLGNGGTTADPKIVGALNEMARSVPAGAPWTAPNAAALDKLSVGDFLAKQHLSADDKIGFDMDVALDGGTAPAEAGLLQYLALINSADSSLERVESMKGGAQQWRFVGGSQILSIRMAQALGDKVRLSSPVRAVRGWDGDVVTLSTDTGDVRARQVVVAMNPCLANQIAFDPPLPPGRASLQRLFPAHAPMRKTVSVYPKPFWRDAGLNGQILQVGGPLIWSYDNSPPDASMGVLNAFVKPGQLPADQAQAERIMTAIFVKALGERAAHPIQFHDLDWGTVDPWTLTCISPMPPNFWTRWGPYLKSPVGRLIWSGTETAEFWASSMDGAVRSGRQAALTALNALAQHS